MDMKNLQVALLSTSESLLPMYTFKRPFPQCFSVPFPIIKYMVENPQSGKVWKKLITSCKYFYSKYPVYPVESMNVYAPECNELECEVEVDGEIFDPSQPFPKLWVYGSFFTDGTTNISSLTTKIFKFDLRVLQLFCQFITFHDYQKLTLSGSIEKLDLVFCEIKNGDGTILTADKLLENLKDLNSFEMRIPIRSMFQPDTVKKMVQHFNRFESMRSLVLDVKETFDFSTFIDFLMKNETIDIHLYFDPVSAAYKEMVENVVKEIKKNPSLKVPVIKFWNSSI